MAFSTAGMSTRRRTGKPASMIMWARPRALAAPPMSFFISSMPHAGLMSRPPVSKQTPLPTSVTDGASASPQARSMRRGARDDEAAAPTAWMSGKLSASSPSPTISEKTAPCAAGEIAGGVGQLRRAKVVGGRVDEVAGQKDAVGDAADFGGVDTGRQDQAARRLAAIAITAEAIGAERPGEACQRRIGEAVAETVGAGRQVRRQLAGQQRRSAIVVAEPEKDGRRSALPVWDEADVAGGGREAGGACPGGSPRAESVGEAGKAGFGKRVDGNGGLTAIGGQQAIGQGKSSRGRSPIMAAWRRGGNPGEGRVGRFLTKH